MVKGRLGQESAATKPKRITTQFMITMNTNKRLDYNMQSVMMDAGHQLFDEDGAERANRTGVFVEPPNFDNDRLSQYYDTGPGGVVNRTDHPEFSFERVMDDAEVSSYYAIETGGRMKRGHMHMVLTVKSRAPVHLDRTALKRYVNEFGRERGFSQLFPYVNIRYVGYSKDQLRGYLNKQQSQGVKPAEIDELVSGVNSLSV